MHGGVKAIHSSQNSSSACSILNLFIRLMCGSPGGFDEGPELKRVGLEEVSSELTRELKISLLEIFLCQGLLHVEPQFGGIYQET